MPSREMVLLECYNQLDPLKVGLYVRPEEIGQNCFDGIGKHTAFENSIEKFESKTEIDLQQNLLHRKDYEES
jgi:hypothetical protein